MTFLCILRMFIATYIGRRGGSLVYIAAYLLTERNFQQRQLQRPNDRKISEQLFGQKMERNTQGLP
jgi:hypothetical protein